LPADVNNDGSVEVPELVAFMQSVCKKHQKKDKFFQNIFILSI